MSPSPAASGSPRVGTLVDHAPGAWPKSRCGDGKGTLETVRCNLKLYSAAVSTAAAQGVELLVLPEAYGLWGHPHRHGSFWEPLSNATHPCTGADPSRHPTQQAMACLAARHRIAIAYNIFATRAGAKRITSVVVDAQGRFVVSYDKVHLCPVVEAGFGATPGTNPATSFPLLGRRWGLVICYEAVYPWSPGGNFDQMEALLRQNATSWLWNVGGMVPVEHVAAAHARKFGVQIVAAMDKTPGAPSVILCSGAKPCVHNDTAVAPLPEGYTAAPLIRDALLA